MTGIIALDIDGTLIVPGCEMTPEVADGLAAIAKEGWEILIISGRNFKWCKEKLSQLAFPYFLAVQNGACLLQMPQEELISKKYLDKTVLAPMEQICSKQHTDFVIYGGYDAGDICYFRPDRFSPDLLAYLKRRYAAFEEKWQAVDSFDHLPLETFAAVKCIGDRETMQQIAWDVEEKLQLHVPLIRDPFDESYYVAQATHAEVSKGGAVRHLKALLGIRGSVIAAGDDFNDLSMLQEADIKIVMATAPYELKEHATLIAPSAEEDGIIKGLHQALELL